GGVAVRLGVEPNRLFAQSQREVVHAIHPGDERRAQLAGQLESRLRPHGRSAGDRLRRGDWRARPASGLFGGRDSTAKTEEVGRRSAVTTSESPMMNRCRHILARSYIAMLTLLAVVGPHAWADDKAPASQKQLIEDLQAAVGSP